MGFQSSIIGCGSHIPAFPRPISVEELAGLHVHPLIGVSAKIVPLCLEKVCRQPFSTNTVKETQGAGYNRERNTELGCGCHNFAPTRFSLNDLLFEIRSQEQIVQIGVCFIGFLDLVQKRCPDDAALTSEHDDFP